MVLQTLLLHARMKIRQARNTISELEDADGNIIIITNEDQEMLDSIPTTEEIKKIVFEMNSDSAPGPDGFPGSFYKSCWDIIQLDLKNAIQFCWRRRFIPKGLNSNFLTLIPKCAGAYVKGRSIQEQILLASEMVNEMRKKRRGGNVALKLDISQAYDSVSWTFLLKVMRKYGFSSSWCNWLLSIFESAKLSVMINGGPCGFFSMHRGLKQDKYLGIILAPGRVTTEMVGQCYPLYNMAVYKWPSSVIKICEKLIRNFLWSGDGEIRKYKTLSWKKICVPYNEGGLGIRRLEVFNKILLMKMMWKLIYSSDEWALFFTAKFKDKYGIWFSKWKLSSVRAGLQWAWLTLQEDISWKVGNGANISVWFDNWYGSSPLITEMVTTIYP
ncbi:uncharacterized protein LOC113327591 [Papaver somniferum]|uniref:uncharacterized protein LOC113327591 n=1 Tax=Papaver somniferum TaxID=3469 RepID=UPI000E6F7DD2|nr:uncharacterized protein LOC113327591 [Papaver somniferum]